MRRNITKYTPGELTQKVTETHSQTLTTLQKAQKSHPEEYMLNRALPANKISHT